MASPTAPRGVSPFCTSLFFDAAEKLKITQVGLLMANYDETEASKKFRDTINKETLKATGKAADLCVLCSTYINEVHDGKRSFRDREFVEITNGFQSVQRELIANIGSVYAKSDENKKKNTNLRDLID